MSLNRGLMASPAVAGQRMRGVYCFAGNREIAPLGQSVHPFYAFPVSAHDTRYTIHPRDARHLGWSESRAHRDFALDSMLQAGATRGVIASCGARGFRPLAMLGTHADFHLRT